MEKTKKKQLKKSISWAVMAVVVLVLAILPMAAADNAEEEGPEASILTAQVLQQDLETRLIGGGQLASEESLAVTIPENVKLTQYLVGNGDTVLAGDPIATVDKVSVMTAITQVQETLDLLTEQIAGETGETSADSVTAKSGGIVKAVYGQPGDSVSDVMLEHGALAVVSLDGLMAVQARRQTALEVGDKVFVAFADGSEVQGRVKNNLDGVLTVTVEDEKYPLGEKVTVLTEDGDRIGSGELYVLNQWNVVAYEGTIAKVRVKENDTVRVDQTLFTLEELGNTADFQRLIDRRQEYELLIRELFEMYSSGIITAPCDGIITGVDQDGAYLLSQPSEESWKATVLAFFNQEDRKQDDYRISLLTQVTPSVTVTLSETQATVGTPYSGVLTAMAGEQALTGTWSLEEEGLPPWLTLEGNVLSGTAIEPGSWQLQLHFLPEGAEEYTEFVVTITAVAPAPSSYTGIVARVTAVMDGVLLVKQYPQSMEIPDPENPPEVEVDETMLTQDASYLSNLIKAAKLKAGDDLLLILDSAGQLYRYEVITETGDVPGADPNTPGTGQQGQFPSGGISGGISGGSMPSMGGFSGGAGGFSGTIQQEDDGLYSLETVTIATVTSQEQMKLSITVDEQDITRIFLGQEATVTVDALAGEKFAAAVTQIGASGENNGGNSKFTVELTLDKSGQMLPGMYGTAVIVLEETADALCIPVAALEQQGQDTIVYTAYDEKTGTLGSPVTVTTGVSDGEYVQILSGLAKGDTCWYAYYDTYVSPESSTPGR